MGSCPETGWKGESVIRSEDVMLMTALCVPRYPKSIPAVAAWLDSLLAPSTGIVQAFPSSDLYKVSSSTQPVSRWTASTQIPSDSRSGIELTSLAKQSQ